MGSGPRRQYEKKSASSKDYSQSQADETKPLRTLGVDPNVIEINKGVGPEFPRQVARGEIKTSTEDEQKILRLQRYISYLHNCVETRVDKSTMTQETDIIPWQKRLDEASIKYPQIAAEKDLVQGREMSHFEIEALVTGETEKDLRKIIQEKNPDLEVSETTEVADLLRQQIMADIKESKDIVL